MVKVSFPVPASVKDDILKESLIAIVPVPLKFIHAFALPCYKTLAILLLLLASVNVFTLNILAIMRGLPL